MRSVSNIKEARETIHCTHFLSSTKTHNFCFSLLLPRTVKIDPPVINKTIISNSTHVHSPNPKNTNFLVKMKFHISTFIVLSALGTLLSASPINSENNGTLDLMSNDSLPDDGGPAFDFPPPFVGAIPKENGTFYGSFEAPASAYYNGTDDTMSIMRHHDYNNDPHNPYHPLDPQQKPAFPYRGLIPISSYRCWQMDLKPEDYQIALQQAIVWTLNRHSRIRKKSWWGTTHKTVTWYFCNCKTSHRQTLTVQEIMAVVEFLNKVCDGPYKAGWVFAHNWQKGYNVVPYKEVQYKFGRHLCPGWCTWV
ncbi:hypothetical protein F4810DRAFT_693406 [Camillea tinctor]|nr:hypothetical protein F4810DRAFT_693406 [Camillea tinctor]